MGSHRAPVAIIALVAALVALALLVESGGGQAPADPRPSSFHATPRGALALYLTLEELGLPVERRLDDWVDGAPLSGVLTLLAPAQGLSPAEVSALVAWIEEGGTLLLGARRGDAVLDALGLSLEPLEGGAQAGRAPGSHPWTLDAGAIADFSSVVTLASDAPGTASMEPLLQTPDSRAAVLTFRRGNGVVVVWSDVAPLTNAELRSGGAALVFARMAADLAGGQGPLVFDEYHHGYREGLGAARATLAWLRGTRPGHVVMQLAVVGLALVWMHGRRFGAPYPPPETRRRSPLEHVDALAGAYHRGGARASARRLVVRGIARRLGQVPPLAGAEGAWLERLASRRTAVRGPAHALLAEWQRGPQSDLVALAAHADAVMAAARVP